MQPMRLQERKKYTNQVDINGPVLMEVITVLELAAWKLNSAVQRIVIFWTAAEKYKKQ